MTPDEPLWRRLPLEKLEAMLKAEAERGRAGRWTFDEPRYDAMRRIYRQRLNATKENSNGLPHR